MRPVVTNVPPAVDAPSWPTALYLLSLRVVITAAAGVGSLIALFTCVGQKVTATTRTFLAVGAIVTVAQSGCLQRSVGIEEQDVSRESQTTIPAVASRNIDMLFVVDNSGSMLEEQTSLQGNFRRLIQVLENTPGGLPSVHIGVISSDVGLGIDAGDAACGAVGDDGRMGLVGGCPGVDGAFLRDLQNDNGTRDTNYQGDLSEAFSCLANLGTFGCGMEQPLESIRRALDNNPANEGFIRDNAYLAIIIVSDEDDCSASDPASFFRPGAAADSELGGLGFRCTRWGMKCDGREIAPVAQNYNSCEVFGDSPHLRSPESYAGFVKSIKKSNPNGVIVAAITGEDGPYSIGPGPSSPFEPQPSCQSAFGTATPALRIGRFVDQFGDNGTKLSICSGDFSAALDKIGELIVDVVDNPCVNSGANIQDTDPSMPGTQLACELEDVDPSGTHYDIPACPMNGPNQPNLSRLPCWWVEADEQRCSATGLLLQIERAADPPLGTSVSIRCSGDQT
jgi:hypothetical protein